MDRKLLRDLAIANFPIKHQEPTLSELIEACGNDFYMLEKTPVTNWKAQGTTNGIEYVEFEGHTAEEAVSNLWLALNKK